MKRLFVLVVVVILIGSLTGCGSKNTPTTSGITVSPATSSIKTGETVQFTFTSTGSTTVSAVNWQVNGQVGGDLTNGTISVLGFYIAPANVPAKNPVTITAVSATDSNVSGSATVTIGAGTPVAISILPATASVGTSQTAQFTATVTNTANTAVSWFVNDTLGGDATHGTIDSTGLYRSPASVPTDAVTVKATSIADSTKSATAAVTVTPFRFVSITASSDVQPLLAGAMRTFTAQINGVDASVTWTLSCGSTVTGACGDIVSTSASTGLYTAPRTPPPGGDVNITATTTDNSANPGSTVVSIAFGNGSLNGLYAFSLAGQNAAGAFVAAGSITFDGAGRVTSAIEDVNAASATSVSFNAGSYNVGTDGRGTVTLQQKSGDTVLLEIQFRVALVDHTHLFMNGFDAGSTATGILDQQTPANFNLASVVGNYALSLAGQQSPNAAQSFAIAGALTADGSGAITAGLLDANNAGTVNANVGVTAGTVGPPDAVGRGTLTLTSGLGTQNFVYYVVDASHLKLVQTNASSLTAGGLVKQAGGPFANSSFTGSFAFVFVGASEQRPLGQGGIFTLDGAGNVSGGVMDVNAFGNLTNGSISGTYTVTGAATGRTTVTLTVGATTRHYVFYPQAADRLNFLETDADVAAGTALLQNGDSFTHSSISDNYAAALAGFALTGDQGPLGLTGQLIPNGVAALTGVVDLNDDGVPAGGTAVQGSYTVGSSNGRGAATLQTSVATFRSAGFNLYIVDPKTVLLLESDSDRVLTGIMQKQP